jgi:hypothetical protein
VRILPIKALSYPNIEDTIDADNNKAMILHIEIGGKAYCDRAGSLVFANFFLFSPSAPPHLFENLFFKIIGANDMIELLVNNSDTCKFALAIFLVHLRISIATNGSNPNTTIDLLASISSLGYLIPQTVRRHSISLSANVCGNFGGPILNLLSQMAWRMSRKSISYPI